MFSESIFSKIDTTVSFKTVKRLGQRTDEKDSQLSFYGVLGSTVAHLVTLPFRRK